ncbi:MAG: hypothetical protein HY287_07130 [Planctomycetes bacterium]|nr:hypothetical protein [Planctomycetota bacterium]
MRRFHHCAVITASCLAGLCGLRFAAAQNLPWDVYADPQSDSVCDLVNTTNVQLVVLTDTGEFVIVSGTDVILSHLHVDANLNVTFDDLPFGLIDFAEDGDGFRTLWWLTFQGTVVDLDTLTLEPSDSGRLPSEFHDVGCDACSLYDDPTACTSVLDEDADGVPDEADECPNTPADESVDDFGCSCSQVDEDGDGINDCDDDCSGTPLDETADSGGCSCSQLDDDNDGVNNCDDLCPNSADGVDVDADGCEVETIGGGGNGGISFACGATQGLTLSLTFVGLMGMRMRARRGV